MWVCVCTFKCVYVSAKAFPSSLYFYYSLSTCVWLTLELVLFQLVSFFFGYCCVYHFRRGRLGSISFVCFFFLWSERERQTKLSLFLSWLDQHHPLLCVCVYPKVTHFVEHSRPSPVCVGGNDPNWPFLPSCFFFLIKRKILLLLCPFKLKEKKNDSVEFLVIVGKGGFSQLVFLSTYIYKRKCCWFYIWGRLNVRMCFPMFTYFFSLVAPPPHSLLFSSSILFVLRFFLFFKCVFKVSLLEFKSSLDQYCARRPPIRADLYLHPLRLQRHQLDFDKQKKSQKIPENKKEKKLLKHTKNAAHTLWIEFFLLLFFSPFLRIYRKIVVVFCVIRFSSFTPLFSPQYKMLCDLFYYSIFLLLFRITI